MVSFRKIFGLTVLDVSDEVSLERIDDFLRNFEAQRFIPELITIPIGYPVFYQDQQIGWVALTLDDSGCLVIRHFRLDRTELHIRWDVRDFYKGEYENKAPF